VTKIIDSSVTSAEVEAQRVVEARAELAALRIEIRSLSNLLELLLTAVSPKDARFLAQARELEAQIGKGHEDGVVLRCL